MGDDLVVKLAGYSSEPHDVMGTFERLVQVEQTTASPEEETLKEVAPEPSAPPEGPRVLDGSGRWAWVAVAAALGLLVTLTAVPQALLPAPERLRVDFEEPVPIPGPLAAADPAPAADGTAEASFYYPERVCKAEKRAGKQKHEPKRAKRHRSAKRNGKKRRVAHRSGLLARRSTN